MTVAYVFKTDIELHNYLPLRSHASMMSPLFHIEHLSYQKIVKAFGNKSPVEIEKSNPKM
eukprot:scaffold568140_cov11-Prasinocladus_malaysianus.AAC.1